MSQYFPKPFEPFGGDISVKVGLSIYATKAGLKNETGDDTPKLAEKFDLVNQPFSLKQIKQMQKN